MRLRCSLPRPIAGPAVGKPQTGIAYYQYATRVKEGSRKAECLQSPPEGMVVVR
jgi:hypothetical protein